MTNVRNHRVTRERCGHLLDRVRLLREIVMEFIQSRPPTEPPPGVADIAISPQFRAILEKPKDEAVTQETFKSVKPTLPQVVEQWRYAAMAQLLKLLDGRLTNFKRLELATSWFSCRDCGRELTFPRVLHHGCTKVQGMLNITPTTCDDDFLNGIWLGIHEAPWNQQSQLAFSYHCSIYAYYLTAACGKNPETTTAQEMDELSPRFVCRLCSTSHGESLIMTWRRAVRKLHSTDLLRAEVSVLGRSCSELCPHASSE